MQKWLWMDKLFHLSLFEKCVLSILIIVLSKNMLYKVLKHLIKNELCILFVKVIVEPPVEYLTMSYV